VRFADVSATTGLDFLDDARAIVVTDWDGDGDLDLFQVNRTAPQVRFLRNDWDSGHHWLALRLVGTTCNRDAIGARVELYRNGVAGKDVRTIYAGSSFLSQSSKWVHFGLGENADIQQVVVRWPGGQAEAFAGLRADQRYQLVQGSGRAEPVGGRSEVVRLERSVTGAPEESQRARVVLGAPVPLPTLHYVDFTGKPEQITWGQPTLVQLWVSWCPMCRAELTEFTERASQVRGAGVRVIALSVDGLGEDRSNPENARNAVGQLGFPFDTGRATDQLLEKLQLLRGELFSNSLAFPIPTSFLVDKDGQMVALYVGPLEVDQLLADVSLLEASPEMRRQLSIPLTGRWFTPPTPVRLIGLANVYREAGYEHDAAWYEKQAAPQMALSHCALALDCERRGDMRTALTHYRAALQFDPKSARVYNYYGQHLVRQRRVAEALANFRKAIELDPALADAHHNLASLYVLRRQYADAIKSYGEAVRLDPQLAKSHVALGRLLQRENKPDEAATHFQAALAADPHLAPAHVYLGLLRAGESRISEAAEHFAEAIRIAPELADAHEGLAQALTAQGQVSEALPHYRAALSRNPNSLSAATNLAWHLSTCSEPKLRSAGEAIELAERVVRRTERKSSRALDVLAAAYAEAGRFGDAVTTAREAAKLATPSNQKLAEQIQERLELYEKGQPFRQQASPTASGER
jgi:tetratricopeptide (TPR) repeat protein